MVCQQEKTCTSSRGSTSSAPGAGDAPRTWPACGLPGANKRFHAYGERPLSLRSWKNKPGVRRESGRAKVTEGVSRRLSRELLLPSLLQLLVRLSASLLLLFPLLALLLALLMPRNVSLIAQCAEEGGTRVLVRNALRNLLGRNDMLFSLKKKKKKKKKN